MRRAFSRLTDRISRPHPWPLPSGWVSCCAAGLAVLLLCTFAAQALAGAKRMSPLAPAQAEPTAATLYLPLMTHGWLVLEVPLAATSQARAATQTARARPSDTATATASPEASPTASPTILPTPTFQPTASPSATPTPRFTATASPTATGPSPTASSTSTPSQTALPSPTPSITPTPTARNPQSERLRPLAASQSGENSLRFDRAAETYRLLHRGSMTLTWEVDLGHPDNSRGRLAVRQVESGRYPLAGAGLYYRDGEGRLVEPRLMSSVGAVTQITHSLLSAEAGPGFQLTVTEDLEGRLHEKRYTLRMVGRALELRAQSLDGLVEPGEGSYAGLSVGDIEGAQDAVNVRLPYMDAVPVTMLDHRWFVSSLIDYPRSQANALLPRGPEILPGAVANEVLAFYLPDAAGRTRAVDERVWITASPEIEDTFVLPDGPPARHRDALKGRVHVRLEGRGGEPGDAIVEADWLGELATWGLSELQLHRPDWRDPGMLLPEHRPAAPESAFDTLISAAGGRLAPTLALTLTVSPCPGLPAGRYDPADRVIGADGLPKPAGRLSCPGGGAMTDAWFLAPNSAARIAAELGRELRARGARAIDLGELAAYNPAYAWEGAFDNVLDRSPRANHPATLAEAIEAFKELFQGLQAELGPVFGPGSVGPWERGYESFYAGYLDGAARSLSTGATDLTAGDAYLVVPDYELRVVRPRMIGYGMGDYQRFFDSPPSRPLGAERIDSWRATSLAYGHAGAWSVASPALAVGGADYLALSEQVKTYYLMRALQLRYLDAELISIGYVGSEGEQDLSGALGRDYDLAQPRLHLVYDREGQRFELWINHGLDVWTVNTGGQTHLLPQSGWLALGDDGLLAYSALVEAQRVDYLRAPEYRLMDGRGRLTDFEGDSATDLLLRFPDGRAIVESPAGMLRWQEP